MDKPTPAGRKNNKPVHWTTPGAEVLLRYVDKHKGVRSQLAVEQPKALARMHRKLSSAFSASDYTRLRDHSIRDKLTHIWRRNKKSEYHAIKDFWVYGLDALDHDTLKAEYIGINLDMDNSDSDTEDDDSDVPAPPNTKRKRSESAETFSRPVSLKIKKPKTEDTTIGRQVSLPKVRRFQALDEEIEADLLRSRNESGDEVSDSEEDGCGSEAEAPQAVQTDARVVRSPYFPAQPQAHGSQTSTPRIPLQAPKYTFFCTPESMNKRVDTLRKKINKAVRKYLEGHGFPYNQPVTVDLNVVPSREMKSLMARLAGQPIRDWNTTKLVMEKLFCSDNHKKLSLNIIIQGMIGAALQIWCFEPFSGRRWWDNHAMETDVQILLRQCARAEDYEAFRLKAIRNYILTHFVPSTQRLASKQAKLFDQQLMYLLPARPVSNLTTGDDLLGPDTPSQAADPAVLIKGSSLYEIPAITSEPREEAIIDEDRLPIISKESQELWIEDLTAIFQDALLLRAYMEMPFDEKSLSEVEWVFDFPRYQEKVEDGTATMRVMAGMFPKIYAVEKKKHFLPQGGHAPSTGEPVGIVMARAHAADILE